MNNLSKVQEAALGELHLRADTGTQFYSGWLVSPPMIGAPSYALLSPEGDASYFPSFVECFDYLASQLP